jgi:hypothetical protein
MEYKMEKCEENNHNFIETEQEEVIHNSTACGVITKPQKYLFCTKCGKIISINLVLKQQKKEQDDTRTN